MEWSLPPKTKITTTRRITAPPSTMARGGTETATPPTLTASTCAVSTPPMPMALSGPPGLAGSTPSNSPRLRYARPATQRINETDTRRKKKKKKIFKHYKPQFLTAWWRYLSRYCLFTKCASLTLVDSAVFSWCLSSIFLLLFLAHSAISHPGYLNPSRGPILWEIE